MSNGDDARETGAATLVAVALVSMAVVVSLVVADIGTVLQVRSQVAAAADAGALAAAPLTFEPDGTQPRAAAADFVARNGAVLLACDCAVDRTWTVRTVTVVAGANAGTVLAGDVALAVSSRAEFAPVVLFAGDG